MTEKKTPVRLDGIEGTDFTQIFIAIFVVFITLVVIIIYKRRKSYRRGILITGLCDTGKTLIYSRLVHDRHVQTHTSIKENIGEYTCNNEVLKIIDIPGHERLREKFFDQYKDITKGIVYVIDSNTLQQDVRDCAEYLYNILVDPIIIRNCPSLLLLCNKQDHTLSKSASAVKSILEKELNTLRVTKSSQLESVDPKARKHATLGDPSEDFDFAALHLKVDIAEGFAYHQNGTVDIDGLKKWLVRQV